MVKRYSLGVLLGIAVALVSGTANSVLAQDAQEMEAQRSVVGELIVIHPAGGQFQSLNNGGYMPAPSVPPGRFRPFYPVSPGGRGGEGDTIVYQLYRDENVSLLVDQPGRVPGQLFQSLADAVAAVESVSPLELVFIENEDVLAGLPVEEIALLADLYLSGTAIASVVSDAFALRQALGVGGHELMISDAGPNLVGVQRDPATGVVHEFTRHLKGSTSSLTLILQDLLSWVQPELANGTDGMFLTQKSDTITWETCITNQYSGSLSGGDWVMNLAVQRLGTLNSYDWFNIQPTITSEITSYGCSGTNKFDCGWYKDYMNVEVVLNSSNATIWSLMPNSSIGGTQTTQSIGADIGSEGVSVSGEISKTYSQSDMNVTNNSNIVSRLGSWKFDFNGPDYGSVPFSKDPPPSVAQGGSFSQTPVVIARVPEGDSLSFTVTPLVRHEKDTDVRYVFPASIKWTNNGSTGPGYDYTFTVSNTSCQ